MSAEALAEVLARIDSGTLGDPLSLLAYLAGSRLELPEQELNGARRRALLVRAAGGDPRRELHVDDDAVRRLARERWSEQRKAELAGSLDGLAPLARGLPVVREALVFLVADLDLAWRLFALGLLAEELGAGEDA